MKIILTASFEQKALYIQEEFPARVSQFGLLAVEDDQLGAFAEVKVL